MSQELRTPASSQLHFTGEERDARQDSEHAVSTPTATAASCPPLFIGPGKLLSVLPCLLITAAESLVCLPIYRRTWFLIFTWHFSGR